MKRNETRAIKVGNLVIGGNDQVIIQSMTNTKTKDIEATVKQINDMLENDMLSKFTDYFNKNV